MFKPIAAAANDSKVSFSTDRHEPTVTSKTTAPAPTSAPLAGLPKRSAKVLEHINAYVEALASDKPPATHADWLRHTGRSRRPYVHADGSLSLLGEQFKAYVQGKSFNPVTADILENWIEADQSKEDFVNLHNLYVRSFISYARVDHTLTPRGHDAVRKAQGHQFTRCTPARVEALQKLCATMGQEVSTVDYGQIMNLNAQASYRLRKRLGGELAKAKEFMAPGQSDRSQAQTSTNERPDSIKGAAAMTQSEQQQMGKPWDRLEGELAYHGTHANQESASTGYEWLTDELLEKVRQELLEPKLEVEDRGPVGDREGEAIVHQLDLNDWNTDELIDLLLDPEDLMAIDEPDLQVQRPQDRI